MAPPAPSHGQLAGEKEDYETYSEEDEEFSGDEPELNDEPAGGEEEEEVESEEMDEKGEDLSDSETESSEASPSQFKLQPIARQPEAVAKRAREGDSSTQDSSRSDKKLKTEEVEKKSGGEQVARWTDEDEIALLRGMINFKAEKGLDPYTDRGAFFDYIKQNLNVVSSKVRLSSKISRMKKRFLNAVKKGENGEDPVFSKPHECKAFELSKEIWGEAVEKHTLTNGEWNGDKQQIVRIENDDDFWSNYPFLSMSFEAKNGISCPSLSMPDGVNSFVKEKMSLVESAKAKALEKKWKNLFEKEVELYLERLNLVREQTKLAL